MSRSRSALRVSCTSALFILQAVPALGLAQASPLPAISATVSATLDSIAEAHRKLLRIPGLALVVGTPSGRVLYAANFGFADLASLKPVSDTTTFRIFSISKPFAAAVAHQLVQEQYLALDAPVGRYLPDLPVWRDSVTVRDVLAHTSGIEDYTDVNGWRTGVSDETAFVATALKHPLHFSPGTGWRYSNTNFIIVQRLIERVSGQPYPAVLKSRLLDRWSLSATTLTCSPRQLATGYLYPPEASTSPLVATEANTFRFSPAVGGLCSTARDVAHFFALLLSGRIVSPTAFAEMVRVSPDGVASSGAGLYAQVDAEGFVVSHGGGSRNGTSEVTAFPRDSLLVVVLANMGGANLDELARAARRTVLGIPQPAILDLPFAKEQFAALLGTYPNEDDPSRRVTVYEAQGQLYALGARLLSQGDGTFVPDDARDLRVEFDYKNGIGSGVRVLRYGVVIIHARRQ